MLVCVMQIAKVDVVQRVCGLHLKWLVFRPKESPFILCSAYCPNRRNLFLSRWQENRFGKEPDSVGTKTQHKNGYQARPTLQFIATLLSEIDFFN